MPQAQLLNLHLDQFCAIFEDILVASHPPDLIRNGWLDKSQLFTVLAAHRQIQVRESLPRHMAEFRRYPGDWITRQLTHRIGVESQRRDILRASGSRLALWYLVEEGVALAP